MRWDIAKWDIAKNIYPLSRFHVDAVTWSAANQGQRVKSSPWNKTVPTEHHLSTSTFFPSPSVAQKNLIVTFSHPDKMFLQTMQTWIRGIIKRWFLNIFEALQSGVKTGVTKLNVSIETLRTPGDG